MPPVTPNRLTRLLGFLHSESTGGITLILAAAAALAWSNSGAAPAYFAWLGRRTLGLSAAEWVNEGLMTLFFLAVSLEIRRELTEGQLATLPRAAAPALAALGGMIVPAALYAAVNAGDTAGLRGWAVPVATDIAFALAALRVLGRRAPAGLKVFLTALAIIDDLGAIVIIALFYGGHFRAPALAAAAAMLGVLAGLRVAGVRRLAPYLGAGALLWLAVLRSGLHPTMAGVALAFAVPMRGEDGPAHRLETGLQPWISFLVLPLFGLANAGVSLGGVGPELFGHRVVIGIVLGLVLGKQIGVFGGTAAAVRLGLARMPPGVTWRQLYGGAALCGIGFTMSLFIGDLSFRGTPAYDAMKLAVFGASLIAAGLGSAVLLTTRRAAEGA